MLTDAELTILGLVAEGPRFGNEIQQVIEERDLREWLAVGFSSIYYILNKLERQHMVTSYLRQEGSGAARKVYEITEAGRGVLQTAIMDLLRQPRALGKDFELGLANLGVLRPQQVYGVLNQHQSELRVRMQSLEQIWAQHQASGDVAEHIRALYTHHLAVLHTESDWLATFLADWQARYPAAVATNYSADPQAADTRTNPITPPADVKKIQRINRPSSEE